MTKNSTSGDLSELMLSSERLQDRPIAVRIGGKLQFSGDQTLNLRYHTR